MGRIAGEYGVCYDDSAAAKTREREEMTDIMVESIEIRCHEKATGERQNKNRHNTGGYDIWKDYGAKKVSSATWRV